MPIRSEMKALYPANWNEISARIRYERAGNKCEKCGVKNHSLGARDKNGNFMLVEPDGEKLLRLAWPRPGEYRWFPDGVHRKVMRIVLTVAHLNHDPADCRDENLAAWCQRCHNQYDAAMRRERRKQRENDCADLFDGK